MKLDAKNKSKKKNTKQLIELSGKYLNGEILDIFKTKGLIMTSKLDVTKLEEIVSLFFKKRHSLDMCY